MNPETKSFEQHFQALFILFQLFNWLEVKLILQIGILPEIDLLK